MKRLVGIALVATLLLLAVVSCTTVTAPVSATGNAVGSKVGESSGSVILGMFGNVDASMRTAANNGGISKISTVDLKVNRVFGYIVVTYTCIVTGE